MSSILVIVGILAVWRFTYMIQNEAGPGGIFHRIQAWAWSGKSKSGSLKDGLQCFYCISIWISAIISAIIIATIPHSSWWLLPIYTLALSSGAVFMNILHEKLDQ